MELKDFPPFYTIQPVLTTQEKQIELWKELILKSCESTLVIDIKTFPLFNNDKIKRSLDSEGRRIICESLILSGHGEWEDPTTKTTLRVFSRTPEAWSALIYEWAIQTARVGGDISTFYEIHSGDDVQNTELAGINPNLLLKALKILEKQGKVVLYLQSTIDEIGVKFV